MQHCLQFQRFFLFRISFSSDLEHYFLPFVSLILRTRGCTFYKHCCVSLSQRYLIFPGCNFLSVRFRRDLRQLCLVSLIQFSISSQYFKRLQKCNYQKDSPLKGTRLQFLQQNSDYRSIFIQIFIKIIEQFLY